MSGGNLAAGNSIGTLSINGDLTFNAGGIYTVEVSPSAADHTHVTGSATLTGATVQAVALMPASFKAQTYTILNANGRAAWAHDFNSDRAAAATFQTLPAASFVVNGAAQARDSVLATASAELTWRNGFSLGTTFEGEFSNVTRSFAGRGIVRYVW
jgi:uncharacterized protein with beta-barrel porin domain